MTIRGIVMIAAIALGVAMHVSSATAGETGNGEETIGEVDPTKPVLFNVREEFYNLKDGDVRNSLILRTDIIKLAGIRGFILRLDIPFVSSDMGQGTDHGLGDIYTQALLIPYKTETSFFAVGSGLTVPRSGKETIGSGKWQVSPLMVPGFRFLNPRGLFFVKMQDFVSFAGRSDRSDIHYLTVTPTLVMKLGDLGWVGTDTEVKVDWERDNRRSYKTGILLLRMWTMNFGTWVKPEFPWGENREGDWNLKASLFWNY